MEQLMGEKKIYNTLYQWNNSWVRKKKKKHAIPMEQLMGEKKEKKNTLYQWNNSRVKKENTLLMEHTFGCT
jgi:hypothetical protein